MSKPTAFNYRLYEEALAEIERLREAQRWIPVTERLPVTDKSVLVYKPGMAMPMEVAFYTRYYGEDDDEWYEHWVSRTDGITHWMQLPAPPEKEGE